MRSLLFLTLLGLGLAARRSNPTLNKHSLFDYPNQAECESWLVANGHTDFYNCIFNDGYLDSVPEKTPENGCATNVTMYDTFCTDACFDLTVNGLTDLIDNSPECLNFFNQLVWPDCFLDPSVCGTDQVCVNAVCEPKCTTKADCEAIKPCENSTMNCVAVPGTSNKACLTNQTTPIYGSGKKNLLSFFSYIVINCAQNDNLDYCMLYIQGANSIPSWDLTCPEIETWGCCAGTLLGWYTYCGHEKVHDELYTCSNSNDTCAPVIPPEWYCVPLCNGDNDFPAHGMTGTCANSTTLHLNETCEQQCNSTFPLASGHLQRTCQVSGYFTTTDAKCGAGLLHSANWLVFGLALIALFGM